MIGIDSQSERCRSHMNTDDEIVFELPDADLVFYPRYFAEDADRLFAELLGSIAWRQENIKLYGRAIPVPRLTAWYGDVGTAYIYSGINNVPARWTPTLSEIKSSVEKCAGVPFNSALLNRYRTGQDSVAWHSDDEKEFGLNPVIASVSFGATRRFQLRHKSRAELRTAIQLAHGSLLVMRGTTQHHWLHRVPKTAKPVGERINLTFRLVRIPRK